MGGKITQLLQRVRGGDTSASDELVPLVYEGLHRIAGTHLRRERPNHTLQPTALVNEAYLRLFRHTQPQFADRVHFMAIASRIMRHILVDYARARASARRGGESVLIRDRGAAERSDASSAQVDLLDLDRAMEGLAQENAPGAEVLEMHYFGGMTAAEMAEATGRTIHVVQHDLRFAHAWLRRNFARRAAPVTHPAASIQQ